MRRSLTLFLLAIAPSACAGGPPAPADQTLSGTWYLDRAGARARAVITWDAAAHVLSGEITDEAGGATESIEHGTWDDASGTLEIQTRAQWIRGRVVEDILVGRFANSKGGGTPELTTFDRHVSGWHEEAFSRTIVPRVFELLLGDKKRARLRIDAAPGGGFTGRMKIYADADVADGAATKAEEDEYDLDAVAWDGAHLRFATHGADHERVYDGDVEGRFIHGSYSGVEGDVEFTGARHEILAYGLTPRAPEDRAAFQARTRRQIRHLMMAGDPAPLSRAVTVLVADAPPVPSMELPLNRDDDPDAHPQAYRLTELKLDYTLPNPYGSEPLTRTSHGQLFVPTSPPPTGGFHAVLALNGHKGSAKSLTDPGSEMYWYGDSYARRGFLVLAIDISHRPLTDRRGLYEDYLEGDDPAGGNGPHPSIKAPGFDSDWEEDGERTWDALRGLEYLRSLPDVNTAHIILTGHSMGAEVSAYLAALDEGVSVAVLSGPPSDLAVMRHHYNHPCWRWLNADAREYIGVSDLHALTAPRGLLIQSGKLETSYSWRNEHWAGAKQSARRVRAAYAGDSAAFLYYLHYDKHHYHMGDFNPSMRIEAGVRVPVLLEPESPWSLSWQTDGATTTDGSTIFDVIEALSPP